MVTHSKCVSFVPVPCAVPYRVHNVVKLAPFRGYVKVILLYIEGGISLAIDRELLFPVCLYDYDWVISAITTAKTTGTVPVL